MMTTICATRCETISRPSPTPSPCSWMQKGSYMARTNQYDLVILDYSMPEKNGEVVLREIRGAGLSTPILFLSVGDEIEKKVATLGSGADDHAEKPFVYAELSARIKAILRRPPEIKQEIMTVSDIRLDISHQAASLAIYPLLNQKRIQPIKVFHKQQKFCRIQEHDNGARLECRQRSVFKYSRGAYNQFAEKTPYWQPRIHRRNIPGRGYMITDGDSQ